MQAAQQSAGKARQRIVEGRRRLPIVPVQDGQAAARSIVASQVEHHVITVQVQEVQPQAVRRGQNALVPRLAKAAVLLQAHQPETGVLQSQEDAGHAGVQRRLDKAHAALGDGLQAGLDQLGVLAQVRQQPLAGQVVGLGERVKDGPDEGCLFAQLLAECLHRREHLSEHTLARVERA